MGVIAKLAFTISTRDEFRKQDFIMSEDIELYIQSTLSELGPFISRPRLTPVLLRKPPFRYLYDIVVEATRISPVFAAAYLPQELEDHTKVGADKNTKMDFLAKFVSFLQTQFPGSGVAQVSPAKIVAGLEPEKTNLLLQLLGKFLAGKSNGTPGTRSETAARPGASQSLIRTAEEPEIVHKGAIFETTTDQSFELPTVRGALVSDILSSSLKDQPVELPGSTSKTDSILMKRSTVEEGPTVNLQAALDSFAQAVAPAPRVAESYAFDVGALAREEDELRAEMRRLESQIATHESKTREKVALVNAKLWRSEKEKSEIDMRIEIAKSEMIRKYENDLRFMMVVARGS